jgi:hypothetical protein
MTYTIFRTLNDEKTSTTTSTFPVTLEDDETIQPVGELKKAVNPKAENQELALFSARHPLLYLVDVDVPREDWIWIAEVETQSPEIERFSGAFASLVDQG